MFDTPADTATGVSQLYERHADRDFDTHADLSGTLIVFSRRFRFSGLGDFLDAIGLDFFELMIFGLGCTFRQGWCRWTEIRLWG